MERLLWYWVTFYGENINESRQYGIFYVKPINLFRFIGDLNYRTYNRTYCSIILPPLLFLGGKSLKGYGFWFEDKVTIVTDQNEDARTKGWSSLWSPDQIKWTVQSHHHFLTFRLQPMRGEDHDVYRLLVIIRLHSETSLIRDLQLEDDHFRQKSHDLY